MTKTRLVSVLGLLLFLFIISFSACSRQPDVPLPVRNIETFTRLYGYVKHFYPGDGAAGMNWDQFAVYGVKKVEQAQDSKELKKRLEELFLPMAPGIVIYDSGQKVDFSISSIAPGKTEGKKVVSWQHLGWGSSSGSRLYKSIRLNRREKHSTAKDFGTIAAQLPGKEYRGKEIKFRAAIKTEVIEGEGQGQLWLRVDRNNRKAGFFDNMGDRPVKAKEWQYYEISGKVDEDAVNIAFGCFLLGRGNVWVDDLAIQVKEGDTWIPVKIDNEGFEADKEGNKPAGWGARSTSYDFKVTAGTAFVGKKSLLITDKPLPVPGALFTGRAKFGEYFSKKLGCGLSCIVPLALYGTDETTYPEIVPKAYDALKAAVKEAVPAQLSGDDLYVRLADVVICWNVFQHFFPYFDIVKTDWRASLTTALQSAYENKDKKDFHKTLKKLTAGLKDGHVRVNLMGDRSGFYCPPINWDWIENHLVITALYGESIKDLRAGDIVLELDGLNAGKALEKKEEYISAATPGFRRYRALGDLMRGAQDSPMNLKIKRGAEIIDRTIRRSMELRNYYTLDRESREKSKILKEGIYYLNLDQISMAEIEELLPELLAAKSIICDLRGYPNNNTGFLDYLLKEDDTSKKWMMVPQVIYPDYEGVAYEELGWQRKAKKPGLTNKIIFIIDGRAISAAESFMSFIEHYKLATIIGQPTAGTNGNVNIIRLPGNYMITWTGMRVVKHDGSQHHGVGIIPHIFLERTIKGVRESRDEFLEKAIEIAGQ